MPKVKLGDKEFDATEVKFRVVKEAIYRVPAVESAYITVERDYVDVWIIIPERDTHVLEQIADVQWNLLRDFGPEDQMPFFLELHVIYRSGRSEKEFAPEGALELLK